MWTDALLDRLQSAQDESVMGAALRRFEAFALASSWAGALFILACYALVWGLGE